jgi:tRNA-modifying protein YgfZ
MKYYVKNTGLLSATGKDVIDLIERLSSNDVKNLKAGEFRKTILLNEKGRIVDLIILFNTGEKYFIETGEGNSEKVIAYFDKYTFLEDVKLSVEKNFKKIIFYDYEVNGDDIFDSIKGNFFLYEDNSITYKDDFILKTLNIICEEKMIEDIILKFKDAEKISGSEYEIKRIENGIPEKELNEQVNPLECNLGEFLSFSKGCYIGQEVIARLDAQSKKPKQLVKIDAVELVDESEKIFTEEGKEAGFISSAVRAGGNTKGLGFIRSMFLDYEKNYFVEKNNSKILIHIHPAAIPLEQNKL